MPKRGLRGLTPRQRKMIKMRVQGKTMKQIGDKIGVTAPAIVVALKRVEPELREALAQVNYPLTKALSKMVEMTEAKRIEFFQSNGIVLDSRVVEDNATRLQARREMLRVHGVGNTSDVNVTHSGTITHELTEKERSEAVRSLQNIMAYDSDSENPLLAEYVEDEKNARNKS